MHRYLRGDAEQSQTIEDLWAAVQNCDAGLCRGGLILQRTDAQPEGIEMIVAQVTMPQS